MKFHKSSLSSFIFFTLIITFALSINVSAQENKHIVRMAKLVIDSAHFKKYKDTVKDMVKSLELIDVVPIGLVSKLK